MLEVKTCQPIFAGFESSTLTLADIRLAIPEAESAVLVANETFLVDGATVYLYCVYAGHTATFKKPGVYGDRAVIHFRGINELLTLDSTSADLSLPTSLVSYYTQYNH